MNNLSDEQREQLERIRKKWSYAAHGDPRKADVDFLFSLIDSKAAEGDGYWPVIVDRGDGVKGHYCIGRLVKPGEPYWEHWNKGKWSSAGQVFIGREAAEAQLFAIRDGIGAERIATAMRDECVEKITAQARALEHDRGNCAMSVRMALYEAIGALSSLTLDQEKQQS